MALGKGAGAVRNLTQRRLRRHRPDALRSRVDDCSQQHANTYSGEIYNDLELIGKF
jgi:hypothetical protein